MNLKLERQLIAGFVVGGIEAFRRYGSYIGEDTFQDSTMRKIWDRIKAFGGRGQDFDVVVLAHDFPGDLGKKAKWFVNLMDEELSCHSIPRHIALLNDCRFRQKMISSVEGMHDKTVPELITDMREQINKYHQSTKSDWEIGEALGRTLESIEAARSGEVEYSWGLKALDYLMGGIFRKEMTVLAARPSMGKSSLAMCVANQQLKAGKRVLYIDFESGDIGMLKRFLCRMTGIPIVKMYRGDLTGGENASLVRAASELRKKPLKIDDRPGLQVGDIYSAVMEHKADYLVVDYVNKMYSPTIRTGKTDQLGSIASGLHDLAKSANIPILVLAQLNRGVEARHDKKPMLSDLRASGEIEEYADNVLMIWWPHYYDAEKDMYESNILIEKQRNGPVGERAVYWDPAQLKFGDISRREQ